MVTVPRGIVGRPCDATRSIQGATAPSRDATPPSWDGAALSREARPTISGRPRHHLGTPTAPSRLLGTPAHTILGHRATVWRRRGTILGRYNTISGRYATISGGQGHHPGTPTTPSRDGMPLSRDARAHHPGTQCRRVVISRRRGTISEHHATVSGWDGTISGEARRLSGRGSKALETPATKTRKALPRRNLVSRDEHLLGWVRDHLRRYPPESPLEMKKTLRHFVLRCSNTPPERGSTEIRNFVPGRYKCPRDAASSRCAGARDSYSHDHGSHAHVAKISCCVI